MGEITIVLLLAMIFLGPKKLPELASGLGKLIREIRKTTADVKNEIQLDEAIRKPLEELRDAVTLHPDELKRRDQLRRDLADLQKRAQEMDSAATEPATDEGATSGEAGEGATSGEGAREGATSGEGAGEGATSDGSATPGPIAAAGPTEVSGSVLDPVPAAAAQSGNGATSGPVAVPGRGAVSGPVAVSGKSVTSGPVAVPGRAVSGPFAGARVGTGPALAPPDQAASMVTPPPLAVVPAIPGAAPTGTVAREPSGPSAAHHAPPAPPLAAVLAKGSPPVAGAERRQAAPPSGSDFLRSLRAVPEGRRTIPGRSMAEPVGAADRSNTTQTLTEADLAAVTVGPPPPPPPQGQGSGRVVAPPPPPARLPGATPRKNPNR